jgi:Flp pilus assembly protein TadB
MPGSMSVLPALFAAVAAGLLLAPTHQLSRTRPVAPDTPADEPAALRRLRAPLVALSFFGAWTFVGGVIGAVVGLGVAAVAWRVLGRTESPAVGRRREEFERDLPTAVHLLSACLTAGAATSGALETVSAALPGAVAHELMLVRHRLALGVDPVSVWRGLASHPELRPLGRSMARAHESGASVRSAIERLAGELDAQSRARTDVLARSVEVRAAAPLGVCFLPAFVLLGVVPMVVGVVSSMRLFA